MSIVVTYLLRNEAITILDGLFYNLFYFIHLTKFEFIVPMCSLPYICIPITFFVFHLFSHVNLYQWFQSDLLFCYFSMHVPDKVGI